MSFTGKKRKRNPPPRAATQELAAPSLLFDASQWIWFPTPQDSNRRAHDERISLRSCPELQSCMDPGPRADVGQWPMELESSRTQTLVNLNRLASCLTTPAGKSWPGWPETLQRIAWFLVHQSKRGRRTRVQPAATAGFSSQFLSPWSLVSETSFSFSVPETALKLGALFLWSRLTLISTYSPRVYPCWSVQRDLLDSRSLQDDEEAVLLFVNHLWFRKDKTKLYMRQLPFEQKTRLQLLFQEWDKAKPVPWSLVISSSVTLAGHEWIRTLDRDEDSSSTSSPSSLTVIPSDSSPTETLWQWSLERTSHLWSESVSWKQTLAPGTEKQQKQAVVVVEGLWLSSSSLLRAFLCSVGYKELAALLMHIHQDVRGVVVPEYEGRASLWTWQQRDSGGAHVIELRTSGHPFLIWWEHIHGPPPPCVRELIQWDQDPGWTLSDRLICGSPDKEENNWLDSLLDHPVPAGETRSLFLETAPLVWLAFQGQWDQDQECSQGVWSALRQTFSLLLRVLHPEEIQPRGWFVPPRLAKWSRSRFRALFEAGPITGGGGGRTTTFQRTCMHLVEATQRFPMDKNEVWLCLRACFAIPMYRLSSRDTKAWTLCLQFLSQCSMTLNSLRLFFLREEETIRPGDRMSIHPSICIRQARTQMQKLYVLWFLLGSGGSISDSRSPVRTLHVPVESDPQDPMSLSWVQKQWSSQEHVTRWSNDRQLIESSLLRQKITPRLETPASPEYTPTSPQAKEVVVESPSYYPGILSPRSPDSCSSPPYIPTSPPFVSSETSP